MAFVGDPRGVSFADEVAKGMFSSLVTGVVFHGTDARDPNLAKELDSASFFYDADPEWVSHVGQRAARNREQVASLGVATFVTTPDMLNHVPDAVLLPISIDASTWAASRPALDSARPKVLHRSSGNHATKGTKYILPVLEKLHSQGRIELITPPVIPHHRMAEVIKSCDIVIDQLQSGTYGVTGIEALAAGKLVIANLSAHQADSDDQEQDTCPVIQANPSNFGLVMAEVLDRQEEMRCVAARGPRYVSRLHDGREAARVLADFAASH